MTSESRRLPLGLRHLNLKHLDFEAPAPLETAERLREVLADQRRACGADPAALASELVQSCPHDLRRAIAQS